jgi:hypothetical protein
MVWILLTKSSITRRIQGWFGWFGVCLPIKIRPLYGLDRKSLEQDAGLMLQKQRKLFVF